MANIDWSKFTTEEKQTDWSQFKPEGPETEEGPLAAIWRQGVAGAKVELPQMIGQAMQYPFEPGSKIYEAGKGIADAAAERAKLPENAPIDETKHNAVVSNVAKGARMVAQSVAPALAIGGAAALAPESLAGAGLLGLASAAGALPAALAQGQQTLEKLRGDGVPEEEAKQAARINAGIELGGETIGNFVGGRVFGVGAKALSKARVAGDVIESATAPSILKPWLKATGQAALVEPTTEFGQNYGETAVENAYGAKDNPTAMESGISAIGPTLGMTALLAPFGLIGHAANANASLKRTRTLEDAETDPEQRMQIANTLHQELAAIDPEAATNFLNNVLPSIENNQPLKIDESVLAPPDTTGADKANADLGFAADQYGSLVPGEQKQLGYVPSVVQVPTEDGGTTTIDRSTGPLSSAAVDVINSQIQTGMPLRAYASPLEAQAALEQRPDSERMRVATHPRVDGSYAVVPKTAEALTAMDRKAEAKAKSEERLATVESEDGNASQVATTGGQGSGTVAGGSAGDSQSVGGVAGGRSDAAGASAPSRGTDTSLGDASVSDAALDELAPAPVQPISSMPAAERVKAERQAAARAEAQARGAQLTDDEVASANTAPTEAQQAAGNYQKGHVKIGSLDISIENPAGSTRSGKEGKKSWSVQMSDHYGYIKRTEGADGEQVDVYVKAGTATDHNGPVFVVDQYNPKTGQFDEHKAFVGYRTALDVTRAYDAHFSDGTGPKRRKGITKMAPDVFTAWARHGDTSQAADKAQAEIAQSTGKESKTRSTGDAYRDAAAASQRKASRQLPTEQNDTLAVREATGADVSVVSEKDLPEADAAPAGHVSRQTAEFSRHVAKLFGKRVVFVEGMPADGFYNHANTLYLSTTGSVHHLRLLGHEMLHALRSQSKETYAKLLEAVRDVVTDAQLKSQFRDYFSQDKDKKDWTNDQITEWLADDKNRDLLTEEWMADLSGNRWTESGFWEDVFTQVENKYGSEQAKGIIAKLRLALVTALNKLKTLIRGSAFAVDGRVAEHLDQIRAALATGFADYAKAVKDGQVEQGTGTAKFSGRSAYVKENREGVIVGARPGEFDWTAAAGGTPPPIQHPVQIGPRVEKLGPAVQKILNSKGFRQLVEDTYGVTNLQVFPTLGQFKGKPEPSFALYGEGMTFDAADGISRLLGFAFAQESTIVTQPVHAGDEDTWPAFYVSSDKKLTPKQIAAVRKAAQDVNLDYTTSIDNTAFKFFFDGSDLDAYATKVRQIAESAGLNNVETFDTRSQFNAAEKYLQGGDRQGDGQAWYQEGGTGSSSLFGRAVDHLLVPYARAVGAEGYRFSPDLFADRFGLTPQQREYIREALRPKSGVKLSTAGIVAGTEKLEPTKTDFRAKKPRSNNTDILFALQNRAAAIGQIEPGDYSDEAKKVISQALADEVIYHLSRPEGKSAIGWYDAALKRAKEIYDRVFPDLKENKDREMLFDALLGIASQGNDVHSNSLYAGRMYHLIAREGNTISQAVEKLHGTFGGETRAIENNFLKLEELLDRNGYDKMRGLFNKKMTVGEWNAILRRDPDLFYKGEPLKIEGAARQTVNGWMVFGPKIGSFINNLHGDYSTLTADLWFSRTWNRILGFSFLHTPLQEADKYQAFKEALIAEHTKSTAPRSVSKTGKVKAWEHGEDIHFTDAELDAVLADPDAMLRLAGELYDYYSKGFTFSHDKKDKKTGFSTKSDLRRAAKNWIEHRADSVAAPRNDNERAFQQDTIEAAQRIIKRKTGDTITIADIQAALWYHEKELFQMFGAGDEKAAPADYADAANNFMEKYDNGDLFYVEKPSPRYIIGDKGTYLDGKLSTPRSDVARDGRYGSGNARTGEEVRGYGTAAPGAVTVQGTHYSKQERANLDGRYYGTGMRGAEGPRVRAAADPRLKERVYFYVDKGTGIRPEDGVGSIAHTAQLNNVYDANADTWLQQKVGRELSGDAWLNAFESSVIDNGFDGYVTDFGAQRAAVLLGRHNVPVTRGKGGVSEAKQAAVTAKRTDLPMGKMTGAEWKKLEPRATELEDDKIYYRDQVRFSPSRFDAIAEAFAKRATEALANPRNTQPVLIHSNTPASMQILGWSDRKLIVEASELAKIANKPGFETDEKIGNLVLDLARPGAMFWNDKQGSLNILRREDMRGAPALIAVRPGVPMGIDRAHLMVTAHRLENQGALLRKITSGELKPLYLDQANPLIKQAMQTRKYRVSTLDLLAPENLHARASVQLDTSSRLLSEADLVKWEQDNWGAAPKFSPARAQTETPEFKKWYEGSNLRNADGSPMVLYHGTNKDFSRFGISKTGAMGPGVYLGDDPEVANAYAGGTGANVMPVYARGRYIGNREWSSYVGENGWEKGREKAIKDGVAGVWDQKFESAVLVFDPSNIKSAIGNNGQFDGANPDIRYSPSRWYFSPLQRAFEQAPDRMFSTAPQIKAWLSSNAGKLGVKQDEIQWSGINDWLDLQGKQKISKDQVVQYLANNGVQVEEVEKGKAGFDEDNPALPEGSPLSVMPSDGEHHGDMARRYPFVVVDTESDTTKGFGWTEEEAIADAHSAHPEYWEGEDSTHYGQYVLPGGKNYRELLLTLPEAKRPTVDSIARELFGTGYNNLDSQSQQAARDKAKEYDSRNYSSPHWGEKNILAHVRMNDRTDADGKKVLFIEELQSDWGQAGKREGFVQSGVPDGYSIEQKSGFSLLNPGKVWGFRHDDPVWGNTVTGEYQSEEEARKAAWAHSNGGRKSDIPTAPFVTDTKAWVSLAVKRMIAYAVENGYDKVAFVNGEQSADRYDLSKQVDRIALGRHGDHGFQVIARKNGEVVLDRFAKDARDLESLVGKDITEKYLDGKQSVFEGLDLQIGGEGMKAFYDKIVPQTVSEVLKKVGGGKLENIVVLEDGAVNVGTANRVGEQTGFSVTPAMREQVSRGLPLFSLARKVSDAVDSTLGKLDAAVDGLSNLPDQFDYLRDRYLALGKIARVDEISTEVRKAFDGAAPADKQAVYDYLTTRGATTGRISDHKLRSIAKRIKDTINYTGDQLVARGLLDQEARDHYRDQYLPRMYLRHMLDDQAFKVIGMGKKPSDMGYLKHRKDIPQEIRDVVLGEIKDPSFLSVNAIGRAMRDVSLLDWMGKISQNNDWVFPEIFVPWQGKKVTAYWLRAEADRIENQSAHYTPANKTKADALVAQMRLTAHQALGSMSAIDHKKFKQIPDTRRYGLLRGMWVRTEIYNDIMGASQIVNADPTWFEDWFGFGGKGTRLTQWWKFTKVAANPPGQIRNFISNMVMLQLSGIGLHRLPFALIEAARDITNNGKYWQVAKKYGVTESTFTAQELFRVKRDLVEMEAQKGKLSSLRWLMSAGARFFEGVSDLYQFSEALGKTIKIMEEMKAGKSEAEAAIEAQKWLFDYSLVPQSVRIARNAPVGMPFLTYQVKVLPRLLEVAAKYPWRFLPWAGLLYGMQAAVASMFGVDDDELKKLKKSLPEWLQDRGHTIFLPFRDADGRLQVADVGYFFPWTFYSQTGKHVADGKVKKALVDDVGGQFSAPILGAAAALMANYDTFTKQPIYKETDPVGYQAAAIANYAYDLMAPPFISSHGVVSPMGLVDTKFGGKLTQALAGTTNRFGDPKATEEQALGAMLGFNFYGMDPEHTRVTNLKVMEFKVHEAEKGLKQRLMDKGLSSEQRLEAIRDYRERMSELQQEMLEYAKESQVPEQLKVKKR